MGSRCKKVSNRRIFNLTGPCARDVEMKLAAGPESQKKPLVFAKVLRSDACAAREPRKMAEVGRAETGHVLGGGLSERGQCEEALNPE